jgi:GNAT superfamily N-acetyltransferase
MENDPLLIVRRVMPVDLRGVTELLVERQRNLLGGQEPDVDRVRNAAQAALEHPGVLAVGAYHEGQPGFAHGKLVGLLLMHLLVSVEDLGEVGWIETLYVRPPYRKRGLAERLLGQSLDFAGARGLRRLEVEFWEQHETEAATHLYRKHGFELVRRSRMSRAAG